MNAVVTLGLSRRFGRTTALRNVNLEVPGGAVCALLGPPGAGKTTLLHLLLNLDRPTAGNSWVLGWNSGQIAGPDFNWIGFVPQSARVPLRETTRRHLNYVRSLYPGWDRAIEEQLAQWWSVPPDAPMQRLSRSMRLKVALLAAVAFRPKLLVLDAPFTDLDLPMRREIISGLKHALPRLDATVLITARECTELDDWYDHVAVLHDGELVFAEPTATLMKRHRRGALAHADEPVATGRSRTPSPQSDDPAHPASLRDTIALELERRQSAVQRKPGES